MKKKTIILLWLVTAYSCSNYSSRLKAVLDYSGTNRAELEKVLDHYSQDPADSLKLKASIFLIENMPGHYTFGGPYMKSYNEQLGLLKNCPYYEKKIIQMVPFDHIGYRQQLDIQEDVKYIKADFLSIKSNSLLTNGKPGPGMKVSISKISRNISCLTGLKTNRSIIGAIQSLLCKRTWKPTRLITIIFVIRSLKSKTDFALFYSC